MTYRSVNKRNTTTIRYGVYTLIFGLVVFFWPSIRPTIYRVLEPVTVRFFEVGGGLIIFPDFINTYFTSHTASALKIEELTRTVELLENEVQQKESIIRELSYTSPDIATSTYTRQHRLTMSSLAEDYTTLYGSILFTKGFKDGIVSGDLVYLRGRNIVCRIKDVYAKSSSCVPYTSHGSSVDGVTSSSSVNLTLSGRGGYYLASVVRDAPITLGEEVLLREDQSFVLGRVIDIINNNQDTSWHIFVKSDFNPVSASLFYVQQQEK
ncbi:MAG: hypothetical protein RLZZ308_719 [Candidatus Parcubacteria bacterium]|jgi:cell shape-determining protein MreC